MEINSITKKNKKLKIDNETRRSIQRAMKAKRRLGWMALFVSITLVVSPFIFLLFHWPGANIMYLGIPVFVAMLAISILTLTSSRTVLEALELNSQSAFDEALSRWTMRDLFAVGGYILLMCMFVGLSILILTI